MDNWRLVIGKLNEIVEGTKIALSIGEKAGLYAGARVLLADLGEAVKQAGGNACALEKIGNAKWHIGAGSASMSTTSIRQRSTAYGRMVLSAA
jgi:hypothetical protein